MITVVDPELMTTVPPKFTAYQGFDALFHSVEGYVSKGTNLMALGWVMRASMNPPLLTVSVNKNHLTNKAIRENKTFSVNFPSVDLMEKTDYCGLVSGKRTDKSDLFEIYYGNLETAPMIGKCPLSLECKLTDIYEMPTSDLFIGEIKSTYTEKQYLTDGKPDIKKMNPAVLTMIFHFFLKFYRFP